MAKTTRQTAIFGVEDWRRIYETYREADFQSYDFETLRKSFVDYLRIHHPETFNDYTESSEFIAMLDVLAFMGQSLSYRSDLNARENFIESAERRENVVKLAELVSYTPKRNIAASGFLKFQSIGTTENLMDYNGINLAGAVVNWNDVSNPDWYDQFITIINSALVDSQKVGRPGNSQIILDNKTDEYSVNVLPGFLPVMAFSATVDSLLMSFEAVSATSRGSDKIYEPSPRPDSRFNILYRSDKMGYASPNTGFFLYFKQGRIQTQDITFTDRIANRNVAVNIDSVNNDDVWLYQVATDGGLGDEWTRKEGLFSKTITQDPITARKYYDISTRANDRISLVFGDGVFSDVPTGKFRVFARSSNGREYIINPDEMSNVSLSMSYVSRKGRIETLSMTLSLTQPVSSARERESIDEIRVRAPSRYYTQNRMVNGEDYSNLPYSQYGSIIKSKAVNRSSVGASRYLDLIDITGRYSSTNTFADDGILFRSDEAPLISFVWSDRADITYFISTQIKPLLSSRETQHFYYDETNFPRIAITDLFWNQSTALVNQTTGFFRGTDGDPVAVGQLGKGLKKNILPMSLLKFSSPAGFYFDFDNRLRYGPNTTNKTELWVSVLDIMRDGTNDGQGNNTDGSGPVTLNNFVPTGAILQEVIPQFITDIPRSIEDSITDMMMSNKTFGLGYDPLKREWYIIESFNLSSSDIFSTQNARDITSANLDASWIVKFVSDGTTYSVSYRTLKYYFASATETRFFYDSSIQKVYDPKTGTLVNDFIKVLKSNIDSANASRLPDDIVLDIIGQDVEPDGYVDNFKVVVGFSDADLDSVADNPDFFTEIVPPDSLVFFERIVDRDNLERYVPLAKSAVITTYDSLAAIQKVKSHYAEGQLFYVAPESAYYELVIDVFGVRQLVQRFDVVAKTGRSDLTFQYRHNSPTSRRIDPGVTNIIDVYVVQSAYYTSYVQYIRDITNTVVEPTPPTIEQLSSDYTGLKDFKMMSDNIVVNTVKFKPLFGVKADLALQATLKVTRYAASSVSDSEIKSRVILAINDYFAIENWDFGSTFYFSELSAYVHAQIGDIVSSIVLVPRDPTKVFGNLYEIRSEPSEIFVSAATVNDVEVVDAITPASIRSFPQ